MRKIVTIASTAEIKKAPSFYDLLKMRLIQLSKELEQNSLEINKLTDKLVNEISNK
jgi:hypothetical protein